MYATALSLNDRRFARPMGGRDDEADYGSGLAGAFLEGAARHSNEPALIMNEEVYTFGELRETARRWATRLRDLRSEGPPRVGVCARGEAAYLGILAAVFSGAAVVQLNPKIASCMRAMVKQADVDAIIVDYASLAELQSALAGLPAPPPLLLTDAKRSNTDWPVAFDADDLRLAPMIWEMPDSAASDIRLSEALDNPSGMPIREMFRVWSEGSAVRAA